MRESEGGLLNREFIGRHREREQAKTKLLQDGVLLLYGQPLVGKASLALQVAEELREECLDQGHNHQPLLIFVVDCKGAYNWPDVMRAVCRSMSLHEAAANENLLSAAILQHPGRSRKLLLLLLRLHEMRATGHDVTSMGRCLRGLAAGSRDVLTLVTSRRQLHLPGVPQQRVGPLTLSDASELLSHQAPEVNVEEFKDLLQKYCYGLPPLVLEMAELVSGDPMLAFTAAELTQELADHPGLLMEGVDEEASRLYLKLTPDARDHISGIVTLLDGSFSQETLQAVTGVEDARIKTVLRLLYEESSVVTDNDTRRMCIEPLVLHHIRKLGHMAADDKARLRVVTLLGRVLTRAEHDLYVTGQDTVYGHLHGDWPQLQHVLRQAIHCTGDTYGAYLQVALKADKLLAKCFPNEALEFYRNMADAAIRYGTPRDLAVIQGMIGMAVTFSTAGTGWEEAVRYFHMALPVLQEERDSVCYLRLLCDLGVANFRINKLHESEKYLQEAVAVSQEIYVEDEQELIFHLLRARSLLALPCIFKGHLTDSKALLLETLDLCEQYAPHHPDKPVMINSLGLVYERGNEDQDKAFHYYKQSLVERRRYQDVAPGDLVVTLNNVGMQYSRRGDHATAVQYLAEAEAIRARDSRWHYHTALTHQHMGQVAMAMGDHKKAERHLQEAACVYARCTPHHDVRGKVALTLAHIYVTETLCDISQTRHYLQEVCQLAEDKETELSDAGLLVLMSAIQHTVHLEGWTSNKMTSLLTWAKKLLENFNGDMFASLNKHAAIMSDLVLLNDSRVVTATVQTESLTSRIVALCQMCAAMGETEDALALWLRMGEKSQELRSAVTKLQTSAALSSILSRIPRRSDSMPRTTSSQHPGLPTSKPIAVQRFVDGNHNVTGSDSVPASLKGILRKRGSQEPDLQLKSEVLPGTENDLLLQQKNRVFKQQIQSLLHNHHQQGKEASSGLSGPTSVAANSSQHVSGQFHDLHSILERPGAAGLQPDKAEASPGSSFIMGDRIKILTQGLPQPKHSDPQPYPASSKHGSKEKEENSSGQMDSSRERSTQGLHVLDQLQALREAGDWFRRLNVHNGTPYSQDPDCSDRQQGLITESNPPSLCSSDVSMRSVDSKNDERETSEVSILCQRIVYREPTQETFDESGGITGAGVFRYGNGDTGRGDPSVVLTQQVSDTIVSGTYPHLNQKRQSSTDNLSPATESYSPPIQPKVSDPFSKQSADLNYFMGRSICGNLLPVYPSSVNVFELPRDQKALSLSVRGPPSIDTGLDLSVPSITDGQYYCLRQPDQHNRLMLDQQNTSNDQIHQLQRGVYPLNLSDVSLHFQASQAVDVTDTQSAGNVRSQQSRQTLLKNELNNPHFSLSGPPGLQCSGAPSQSESSIGLPQELPAAFGSSRDRQPRHDVIRLPLTMEHLASFAQQLKSVLRPEDPVTSEQRLALEQIASLSRLASGLASPDFGAVDSRLLLEDQLSMLALWQSHNQQAKRRQAPPDQTLSSAVRINQAQDDLCKLETETHPTQPVLSFFKGNDVHGIHNTGAHPCSLSQTSVGRVSEDLYPAVPMLKPHSELELHSVNAVLKEDQSLAWRKLSSSGTEDALELELNVRQAAQSRSVDSSGVTDQSCETSRREPTENLEEESLAIQPRSWTLRSSLHLETMSSRGSSVQGSAREATENDEREHVCISLNCCCSLRPR